jgi:membrane protein
LAGLIGHFLPDVDLLIRSCNFLLSFLVITLLFAMIYKVLPDVAIRWRDVWLGAAGTALLFGLGKYVIGLFLGNSAIASSFGTAGALVVILIWIYYSAQIFLFGAEFIQVYANWRGVRLTPTSYAVPYEATRQ